MFTSTILARGVLLAASVTIIYLILFPLVNQYLGISDKYRLAFMVMAAYLFIRPLNVIVLNYLRATGRTIFFNAVSVGGRSISIALGLVLLIYVIGELYGYFIGVVIAELVVMVLLYRWLLKNYHISFKQISGPLSVKLIKFGLPLLITELAYLTLFYADRYMIVAFRGQDELGLYSVGYSLASYMNDLIMFSLSYAVIPIYVAIFSEQGKEETEEFLAQCANYFMIGVIPICFGFYAVAPELFVVLASDKYLEAAEFSPLILIGLVFLGLNYILYAGLYLNKKTRQIFIIMLSAVLVNIVLNILLIPAYGVNGAAVATLVACMLTTVMTVMFSYRYIYVRIQLSTVAVYFALSLIMYFLVSQIDTDVIWINLVLKIVVGAVIISVGVIAREREIREKLKSVYQDALS